MRLRTQSFLMDSAPLISASLYPALDLVEAVEHLIGETVDFGQVPFDLLHMFVIVCADRGSAELVELFVCSAERTKLGHVTVVLLALGEVPFSEAACHVIFDIGCVELDIAPHHLVHPHPPDHVVGLCKFDHFFRTKAEF